MSVSGTAISSALGALKLYSRQVDRAAEQIATAGLTDNASALAGPGDSGMPGLQPAAGEGADLAEAMTSMLIAQRAFSAQLRVLRTADEMLKESVDITGRH